MSKQVERRPPVATEPKLVTVVWTEAQYKAVAPVLAALRTESTMWSGVIEAFRKAAPPL